MVPMGIQQCASSLVGGAIGQHKPLQAIRYAWLAVVIGLIIVTIICVFFVVFDDLVATIFTTEPAQVEIIKATLPILSVYIWFDSIHGVQTGNIRALGK